MNELSDDQIGKNLKQFRGDMKQSDLADEMRKRGFAWSQNTVYQVESGSRPIRLTEAQSLSMILGFSLEALFAAPKDNELEKIAQSQIDDLQELWEHYVKTIGRLRTACNEFLENEPAGLTNAESEELWQIKKSRQADWEHLDFWSGFVESVYKERAAWHNHEPEPLSYYDFDEEASNAFGVDKTVGFNVAEKLFKVNQRAENKATAESVKDWSQTHSWGSSQNSPTKWGDTSEKWTPPF